MTEPAAPLIQRDDRRLSPLGGFVDSLFQTFEDCRPGLTDDTLAKGEGAVLAFFMDLYEKEQPRLSDKVTQHAAHLTPPAAEALRKEVDRLMRSVVIPAYVRTTFRFTRRERNGFYLVEENVHALERTGWAFAGILLGIFVIVAPFIPLWSKEWVLPFFLGGLFLPEIRRYLATRSYEKQLNEVVTRADREINRIDVAYLMREAVQGVISEPVVRVEKIEEASPISVPPKIRN